MSNLNNVANSGSLSQLYSSLCSTPYLDPSTNIQTNIQSFVASYLSRSNDATKYRIMSEAINYWLTSTIPQQAVGLPTTTSISGLRVQIIEADGTTAYDSSSGNRNIYTNIGIPSPNFLTTGKYLINENQGTRSYNQGAFLSQTGVFYERKFSNSTDSFQIYIAVRNGTSPARPAGVIVISMNES